METTLVQDIVRDNNVDQALKALKKKMQREGIFREMKLRKSYEKPSERKAREKAEAVRRARKLERKRLERGVCKCSRAMLGARLEMDLTLVAICWNGISCTLPATVASISISVTAVLQHISTYPRAFSASGMT